MGSLFPLIQSQSAKADYALSWLQPKFKRLRAWKRKARGRLLELLHYAPPRCDPRPEILERVDCGDYHRERVQFSTTPDLRVPAYVLIPKRAKLPAPGIVALHDHGAFYFWGKEKLIESGDEHDRWGTVGVSPNVIEASWQALVDSIEYKLYKDQKTKRGRAPISAEQAAASRR